MSRAALIFALLCGALPASGAEEPVAWNIRVELEAVAVPMAQASRLVGDLRRPATFAAAEARMQALVAAGGAELIEQLQVTTFSGQKGIADSLEDIRYREEVDLLGGPAFLPIHTPYAWEILRRNALPAQAAEQERIRRRQQRESDRFAAISKLGFPFNPSTQTGIDTRYIGTTLDAEPQFYVEAREINLSVAAQWISFDGLEYTLAGRAGAPTYDPPQPRFSSCHFHTTLTLGSGKGALLGTHIQHQPRPRMLLFLVRATVLPAPFRPRNPISLSRFSPPRWPGASSRPRCHRGCRSPTLWPPRSSRSHRRSPSTCNASRCSRPSRCRSSRNCVPPNSRTAPRR